MFDIGFGEILLLGVIGMLVFGPEKLPKATSDAARLIRQFRAMATNAKNDLAKSAGVDMDDTMNAVRGLADLHPRRLATSIMADVTSDRGGVAPFPPAPASPHAVVPGAVFPRFDPDAT